MDHCYTDPTTGEIKPMNYMMDINAPFFKTPHNHDTKAESDRTAQYNTEPSKTQQHSKDETDINTIVDRFLKTGALPPVRMPPTYEDFGDIFDLQSAMNLVKDATDSFLAMPANIRNRFQNDPAKFVAYVDYCVDNGDLTPLREMGLAVKDSPPDPKNAKTGQEPPTPPKTPPGGSSDTDKTGVTQHT